MPLGFGGLALLLFVLFRIWLRCILHELFAGIRSLFRLASAGLLQLPGRADLRTFAVPLLPRFSKQRPGCGRTVDGQESVCRATADGRSRHSHKAASADRESVRRSSGCGRPGEKGKLGKGESGAAEGGLSMQNAGLEIEYLILPGSALSKFPFN
jgi:hypothetical protein